MQDSVQAKPASLLTKCTERAHWKTTISFSFILHLSNCHKTDPGTTWENIYTINFTLSSKIDFQRNP